MVRHYNFSHQDFESRDKTVIYNGVSLLTYLNLRTANAESPKLEKGREADTLNDLEILGQDLIEMAQRLRSQEQA